MLSHDRVIYTDGSVNPATKRAGAAWVLNNTTHMTRVTDGASSTQTELVAVLAALRHCAVKDPHMNTLILSDSLAALQTLRGTSPDDNLRIVTEIHHHATIIQSAGGRVSLHWIPSHVGIKGNNTADEAAKEASLKPTVDIETPPSLSSTLLHIRGKASNLWRDELDEQIEAGSPSANWFARATGLLPPDLPKTTPSHARISLHRLRLGFHCKDELLPGNAPLQCQHCATPSPTPLIHYVLDCPATREIRVNHPTPQPHVPRHLAAADIIRMTPDAHLLKLCIAAPPPR